MRTAAQLQHKLHRDGYRDGTGPIYDSNGNSITGNIPSGADSTNAHTGPAVVCFMSVDSTGANSLTNGEVGTNPAYLTVL